MDSKRSLHGFLGTLLSPDMSADEKREVGTGLWHGDGTGTGRGVEADV